jgi:hypothetical protein
MNITDGVVRVNDSTIVDPDAHHVVFENEHI